VRVRSAERELERELAEPYAERMLYAETMRAERERERNGATHHADGWNGFGRNA
jgi:hypothetical protein